ncbi:Ribosomal RNA small subunit methyltransferase B [Roseivivax sp. THAF40]|uniref:RsmB/NOP family class I SAM-dependent RNA methyltransferase n=1 Tax=unclassified Roseivivax TaxID=2639302 RepID=UPI00126944A3|nr:MULTISPECIES: transcription antitermination factor NusB [unclassified Roseivivax]QFS81369.1 Ribosomal RNA small subunit methyltransferase B [Roseivivax sp. THAF197b]QFT45098.1 Ribosomal RNA small subunit methyltransferase B [Roseivivax sp. THAF40]
MDQARRASVDLLDGVLGEGRLLSELTGGDRFARLAPEDRAAAQRLTADVLRHIDRADRLLSKHLKKAPPLRGQNILRLGTVELAMGGAAHGVVNACVGIAEGHKRTKALKGLINAVLRKMVVEAPATWADLPPARLPEWLRGPLLAAWGRDAVRGMEAAHQAGAPLDLTARGDAAALADAVGGTLLPTGSVRLDGRHQVSALPGYGPGEFWVQDAAAALPVRLMGDIAGQRALDLCAAPGGKTMQLAAAGAEVTALDLSAARLTRVQENLDRTKLKATLVQGDALLHEGGPYDVILLDAPCSATGTIRRHPDLPHARTGEGISELIDLQARMLDHALSLLAPGGRLMFCTCSIIPDEGEVQIDEALTRHADLSVLPLDAPWIEEGWRSSEGGLRLRPDFWPDRGGMDGFYMACLAKG